MRKFDIELKRLLSESDLDITEASEQRYRVEIDFHVFGKDEEEAKAELQEIIDYLTSKYDNNPKVIDFKKQNFGKQ